MSITRYGSWYQVLGAKEKRREKGSGTLPGSREQRVKERWRRTRMTNSDSWESLQ
jgi:hypothetical protein